MGTERAHVDEGTSRELSGFVRELMGEHGIPGVVVGIHADGEDHVLAFGVTSVEHPLPVDEDTLFQIGSTTKTVTATVLMRLVERGQVDLDARVRTYVPELELADPYAAERVTVRHLLTHTAGWAGDHFVDTGDGDDALAAYVESMATLRQVTPVGELWSYNNAAFVLAGRVVEAAHGASYEQAARTLVLEPLGMTGSFFFPKEVMLHRFAVGHVVGASGTIVARPWPIPRNANAAGGLASSIRDQLRYARFHMGDGRAEDGSRVLEESTLEAMQVPQVAAAVGAQMGLSWHLDDVDGCRIVAHGGATNGQMSSFWMAPGRGFAFTALTNADTGRSALRSLDRWARRRFLGLRETDPELIPMHAEELGAYRGTYVAAIVEDRTGADDRLEVVPEGSGLRVRLVPGDPSGISETPPDPPPPFSMHFYEPDRVMITSGPYAGARAEFLRNRDGSVAWLRMGMRLHARQP
ncbi:MAG: serine hydrolase [Deinococcales bacterium]